MRTIVRGLAAAAALGVGVAGAAAAETKVGVLLPKSGVYASLGNEIEDGFRLALEDAGMADQFTLVSEDTEVKPPVGLAKARKLVLEDRVDVIMGIVSSGVLAAMRDFIHQAEVPLIVANAGNDEATGAQCSPYLVRVSFSNGQVNRPMGQWMAQEGFKKVYTLAPDYAAGRQMIEAFKSTFTAGGGEIVGEEYTPFQQTQDFGPYLTNARASGADALFVFYAGGEAISFVKQYGSFGLKDTLPLFGSGFLNSALYVNAQGEAAIGTKASLHYVPTLETPENQAFVKRFSEKYGRIPSEYAVQGYDAGQLLARAVQGGAKGPKEIAAALPKISYTGPRGPLEIDPATNNVVQNFYIYDTVQGENGLTQKVIATIPAVRDPVNGCTLQGS